MTDTHDTSANNGAMVFDPVTANDTAGRDLGIYKRRGVEGVMVGESEPPPSPEYLAAQSGELIVKEITDRIERHERNLAKVSRFDPDTGQAIPQVHGKAREAVERELATLRYSSLPFAKARAAEIEAAKASMPTTADKLQAEADHRSRVQARAEELALEAEAQELAERLRAAKRVQSAG